MHDTGCRLKLWSLNKGEHVVSRFTGWAHMVSPSRELRFTWGMQGHGESMLPDHRVVSPEQPVNLHPLMAWRCL